MLKSVEKINFDKTLLEKLRNNLVKKDYKRHCEFLKELKKLKKQLNENEVDLETLFNSLKMDMEYAPFRDEINMLIRAMKCNEQDDCIDNYPCLKIEIKNNKVYMKKDIYGEDKQIINMSFNQFLENFKSKNFVNDFLSFYHDIMI